ncbi:MAG: beta-phosphoglucomutase family hydrolase [Alphaproteobacteria bacterium]
MNGDLPNLFALGLEGVLVDLDGVVTRTARVHGEAWRQLFDAYLQERATREGDAFEPFDLSGDYIAYVDGRERFDGVRAFLESRGIHLPYGEPSDPPDLETVCGLGNRKNELFNTVLREQGVEVFDTTVTLLHALRAAGLRTGCVSSSRNCKPVLEAAGLLDLFEAVVDGVYAAEHDIPGKPSPEPFLRCAALLGVTPDKTVVVEDAVSGVQSARAGDFKLVIGVDRGAGREALLAGGAHVVVGDLGEFAIP